MPSGPYTKCKNFEYLKIQNGKRPLFQKPLMNILPDKTANIIKTKAASFVFVVKVTALKQQISKVYLQILSTEVRFYICDRPPTCLNIVAANSALTCKRFLKTTIANKRLSNFTVEHKTSKGVMKKHSEIELSVIN